MFHINNFYKEKNIKLLMICQFLKTIKFEGLISPVIFIKVNDKLEK